MIEESRFKVGESVVINFGVSGVLSAIVSDVIFDPEHGKVKYRIKLFPFPNEDYSVTLNDVDSYFIEDGFARFKHPIPPNGCIGGTNVGLVICNS